MDRISNIVVKCFVIVQEISARLRERATRVEQGQSLVEYALILSFIALVVIVAMKVLQPAISHTFEQTACNLNTAGTPTPIAGTPCP